MSNDLLGLINDFFFLLMSQFEWDIAVMSQPWMYYWLLIPICCFLMFFITKWAVLTMVFWLPLYLIVNGIRK